jgi:3-oxoacyl-[acyl-carrier-protein] synthase III
MNADSTPDDFAQPCPPFFSQPRVQQETIPIGGGVPLGIARVSHAALGIGGAYGAWGQSYDNVTMRAVIEDLLGEPLGADEAMDLSALGFVHRHFVRPLPAGEELELELEVGARLLQQAARANGWDPAEVEGLLIGMSAPVSADFVEQVARRAGISESALKVSIHKACDSSVAALNLLLNPGLAPAPAGNLARALCGKKVLVGGIEGLSRLSRSSRDKHALQLFGNGAGVIALIPGQTMTFLAGQAHEVFDREGVLAFRMYYPHSRRPPGPSLVEVSQAGPRHLRVAGLMPEPRGDTSLELAGMLGMVKLFARNSARVVADVVEAYRRRMSAWGMPGKSITVGIAHHANFRIHQLKQKLLLKQGIDFPMPWLLREFGNVSAASPMIAFLRQLPRLKPADHVLFSGFGAGTYYDVLAVALGG